MAVMTLTEWEDGFEVLPLKADQTWKTEWANWLYDVTSKAGADAGMALTGWLPVTAFDFQFDKSTFESTLADGVAGTALANLSAAFAAAIPTSILTVTAPTTAPLMDTVTSSIVDAPSIVAAQAIITATNLTSTTEDPRDATIIESMRTAFLTLTYTVIGTAGGNPATMPLQGVA